MAEVEVVEALLFGDHEAKIAAAEAVIHLTNKQRHKLADNGAIPPIVSMLHAPPDFKSLESAIFALMSLAYGSERNKIRIAKSGAISLLLNLVKSQIHPLIDHVIAALLILSSCSANKSLMAASGAIRVLNESLLENNTTQAKLDIVVTLHNLSTCHQLIPTIVSSSTVSSLIQLINESEKSSKLVEKSMGLLDHIVSSSEIGLKESAIGIRALVEAVEDGSKTCKEYAVGILLLICESSRERYRGMILREGAIPGLLQLSIDGTHRAKRSAKSLLRLLRDCKKVCRSEMSKNVVLEEVMGEIDRGGTEVGTVEKMIARLNSI
ncbi:U-box domain-containing protein 3 [Cynara cardunculus var. scolymus]|uniref:U-box domain-containing protein 3 n=1 Tax=Cynara cardunculus var. scolymus TaxID=59895 RepID=UPI000D6237AA|nr:U-box domain-containing protein 3 [Cynara cardunculus var. scolymus]